MTSPVPADADCLTWEVWLCGLTGHGYHDSHNPCPVREARHTCITTSGRYAVESYPGVAFRAVGQTIESSDEDGDPVYREGWLRVVMVGDDRLIDVEATELSPLAEGDSCAECGQVGCTADGRS